MLLVVVELEGPPMGLAAQVLAVMLVTPQAERPVSLILALVVVVTMVLLLAVVMVRQVL